MPKTIKENWEEELRKILNEFDRNVDEWNVIPGQCRNPYTWLNKSLVSFIRSLLKQMRDECAGEAKTYINKSDFSEIPHLSERDEAMFDQGWNAHRQHCIEVGDKYINN